MSPCPLLDDAGVPGLRGCFPEACVTEVLGFVLASSLGSTNCDCMSIRNSLGIYTEQLCIPSLFSYHIPSRKML